MSYKIYQDYYIEENDTYIVEYAADELYDEDTLWAVICPLWASTICCAIAKPNPKPPVWRARAVSTR